MRINFVWPHPCPKVHKPVRSHIRHHCCLPKKKAFFQQGSRPSRPFQAGLSFEGLFSRPHFHKSPSHLQSLPGSRLCNMQTSFPRTRTCMMLFTCTAMSSVSRVPTPSTCSFDWNVCFALGQYMCSAILNGHQ